jgi:pantoate--beta-alanine ligase
MVHVLRTPAELLRWRASLSPDRRVAFVPTMGFLHEGHLALLREGRQRVPAEAGALVLSIFVNPTQFAPHEDFERYPRDEAGDLAKLAAVGCDAVWGPTLNVMYAEGFATRIVPAGAADGLESDFRPHFFGGVATVCCKLFTQVQPDIAVFGEKDYQQLMVVTQMVRDLDLPLEIVGAPTVREADGLAMSSRNAYLSAEERRAAPTMHRAIREVAVKVAGGSDIGEATSAAKAALMQAGFGKIDYVEVRDAVTLKPVRPDAGRPLRVLAAAWLGKTRLIDNVGD